jgi:peroxiredoxin
MHRTLLSLAFIALFAACGNAAPGVSLADSDGKTHHPLAKDERAATVIIFLMHDCPVANANAPELARIATEYGARGVRFYGVYATESAQEIAKHRKEYGLPFPGLLDPKLQLARQTGATRVPEAAVLSATGTLLYRGRINDRAVQAGSMKPVASKNDLRLALEAVLSGKPPEPKFTTAVGCYLPLESK